MSRYINELLRLKWFILILTGLIAVFTLYNLNPKFIVNDDTEWIVGSKDFQKLQNSQHKQIYLTKAVVSLNSNRLYEEAYIQLKELHNSLKGLKGVIGIESIFTQQFIFEVTNWDDSIVIESSTLLNAEESGLKGKQLLSQHIEQFSNFIDLKEKKAVFYIYTESGEFLDHIETPLIYSYENLSTESEIIGDYIIMVTLSITLFVLFYIAFKQLSAPVIGTIFIVITSSITIYIFNSFMGEYQPHISIIILSFSVSLMDYIYIYYRWFMLQQKMENREAIIETAKSTFTPILFTTIINILGVGSLMLVSSMILKALGLMVIIASVVGLIFSFTLLPVIFSLLKVKNVKLESEKVSSLFSDRVSKYNLSALKIFLTFTALLFLFSIYSFYYSSFKVETENGTDVIKVVIDYDEVNRNSLKVLHKLTESLPDEAVIKTESIYRLIKELHNRESVDDFNLSSIDLDRYIFLLELYGGEEQFFGEGKLKLDIYLKDSSLKSQVLSVLRESNYNLIIKDTDSLTQSAKLDTIQTMVILIFFVITIIGTVVILMTGRTKYFLLAVYVNLIPLIWFFSAILMLDYPLSTEIFVAMIVSISLSSDATMHFIHFYNSLENSKALEGKSRVEKLMLFIGSPLVLGNVVLALTFLLLIVANVPAIATIGIFTATLIFLSILTDIFVLPVLFLELEKRVDN